MIKITDPFDPLFAPNTGTNLRNLNKKLQNKWVEENVIIGMMPEIATTPLITLRGGKALFSKKAFKAYQNALNKLRKVIKWGDVEGTVRLRDVVSKGRGPHYRSDPDQYFTDKEWAKQEFGEYRNLFAKFIKEERKVAGIGKGSIQPREVAETFAEKLFDPRTKVGQVKRSQMSGALHKHDIWPEFEREFNSGKLLDIIEELRKLQN
jgi:hypothetical protein